MSDEEEVYEEEEVEEEEVEEEADEVEDNSAGSAPRASRKGGDDLNEAEKAMLAAKRRHEDEAVAKLMDYEERRKLEREKEEEELRKLKEKQERRRQEREQEEREMAERKRQDEERRQQEEAQRKARLEEEKKKKEAEKLKKAQMMSGMAGGGQGGRNFVIEKKEGGGSSGVGDKFGNIVQAKQEMGMTKEQQEEAKAQFMAGIRKAIAEASEILPGDMKAKIKELHQRICKLEAQKYDQEKRHERQEYDLKELNERSRQVARSNAQKKGTGNVDDTGGRHPPKVQVASKYDRQIDRRNFKERRAMYENRNAYPVFPGLPPPPAIYEKIIKKLPFELEAEAEAEEAAAYEEEEE